MSKSGLLDSARISAWFFEFRPVGEFFEMRGSSNLFKAETFHRCLSWASVAGFRVGKSFLWNRAVDLGEDVPWCLASLFFPALWQFSSGCAQKNTKTYPFRVHPGNRTLSISPTPASTVRELICQSHWVPVITQCWFDVISQSMSVKVKTLINVTVAF